MIGLIRPLLCGLMMMMIFFGFAAPTIAAERELKTEKTWNDCVRDDDLLKKNPGPAYITNAKAFESLWKAWKLEGKVPEVDFKTELVLVATNHSSTLGLWATINEKGELKTFTGSTDDLMLSGFRYVIISVKKDGVKSVNGKPLKD